MAWRPAGTSFQSLASNASGSITLGTEAPGAFDFSVLGAVDWVHADGWGAVRDNWHAKQRGGWLKNSFTWISPGTLGGATDARAWNLTSLLTDDDETNQRFNASTKAMPGYNGSDAAGAGFTVRIPCCATTRVLRWQGTIFNVTTTVTASFSVPGVGATKTMAINTALSSGADYRGVCTFNGPIGCELVLTHTISNLIAATSGNIYVGAIGCA